MKAGAGRVRAEVGQGSLAGRQTAPPNYPCLCSPLSGYALPLALNWPDRCSGSAQVGGGRAAGAPPGLTRLLAGSAKSAPSCLVDRRLQVST